MILVIGYGNPLRTDDAIGQLVARSLEGWHEDIKVLTAYQLTPELAEPISHAWLVIFIDARAGYVPGTVVQEAVKAHKIAGIFTHNVSPASLLGASQALYHTAPIGIMISIVGTSFDYGSDLSPELQEKLPAIIDQIRQIIDVNTLKETSHA
jgi:hydrogenase maturation protease